MKKVSLFKVKSGKLERWKEWASQLDSILKGQALETLSEEGLVEEACFLFEFMDENLVLAFIDGEMLAPDMNKTINQKHQQMKDECLEYITDGETLYHLKITP
ncbi:MAG: DUF6176 family protein [Patescibacteria group bacterium]|mgnify:CR=1 FL=1